MSNIRGGHKKLILTTKSDSFEGNSFKYLSFMLFDGDLKILNRADADWYPISFDPDTKISAKATNYDRMYLVYINGSTGNGELAVISNYIKDVSSSGNLVESFENSTLEIVAYVEHPTTATNDNLLVLFTEDGVGTSLKYYVCNSITASISYTLSIYSETYNYRQLVYDWGGVSIFDDTNLLISRHTHEYQSGVYIDNSVGVGYSTLNSNVIIFTEEEEFYGTPNQNQNGNPPIRAMARLKVYRTLDGGNTLTDISSNLNPTYSLNNTKWVVDHLELDDELYPCDSIYWVVSYNGRMMCGVQPPFNKYDIDNGSTTRLHVSRNYGNSFDDERQITVSGVVNTFYMPVCSNMGSNGNVLLGKYKDSFEDSYTYDEHLQLSVYNILTGQLYEIDDMLSLIDWSVNYYKPSTYQISIDGNTVIVGGSFARTAISQYKMIYFKVDISNPFKPVILDYSYYPNFISALGFGVSSIITNF